MQIDNKNYLFRGANTNGLAIDKDWCINIMCKYLDTRKPYNWVRRDELLFILDEEEEHVITLEWHNFGFNLEHDLRDLDGEQLEIVLIGISIVFRSICEHYNFFKKTANIQKTKKNIFDDIDEEYWI